MIEEVKDLGQMSSSLNSTFIALVPKKYRSDSFDEFRPILMCNFLYKLISKFLASRIKRIISEAISQEQQRFLADRQIYEAIGAAQEGLHIIKSKKVPSYSLKTGSFKGL